MELSGRAALVAATISVGLLAGVFGIYANSIMPGLGRTDDRTFVGAFQSIDRAIINPVFLAPSAARWCSPAWPWCSTSARTGGRCWLGWWPRWCCTWWRWW